MDFLTRFIVVLQGEKVNAPVGDGEPPTILSGSFYRFCQILWVVSSTEIPVQ